MIPWTGRTGMIRTRTIQWRRNRRRRKRRRKGEKAPTHPTTRCSKGTKGECKKQARKQQGSHQWLPKRATGLKDAIHGRFLSKTSRRGRRDEQRGKGEGFDGFDKVRGRHCDLARKKKKELLLKLLCLGFSAVYLYLLRFEISKYVYENAPRVV